MILLMELPREVIRHAQVLVIPSTDKHNKQYNTRN